MPAPRPDGSSSSSAKDLVGRSSRRGVADAQRSRQGATERRRRLHTASSQGTSRQSVVEMEDGTASLSFHVRLGLWRPWQVLKMDTFLCRSHKQGPLLMREIHVVISSKSYGWYSTSC